ncbi:MAG: Siroheme synthase [Calditrichaeota bacterium]|nr:Siroheme synthase [Calditrichota bacterium]
MLPLIFRGDRIRALIVGGGVIAKRKAETLLEAGADTVTVIAPAFARELRELAGDSDAVTLVEREFRPGELRAGPGGRPYTLAIGATDDPATNRAVSDEARAAGVPVNVVDVPELCTVFFAATVRDDPLLLAVSTAGHAPFLARGLKRDLHEFIGPRALRARWAARFRRWVRERVADPAARDALYDRFLATPDADIAAWSPDDPPFDLWRTWADCPKDRG